MLGSGHKPSNLHGKAERKGLLWPELIPTCDCLDFSIVTCNKNIKYKTIKIISAKQETFKLHAMIIFLIFLLQVCLIFYRHSLMSPHNKQKIHELLHSYV